MTAPSAAISVVSLTSRLLGASPIARLRARPAREIRTSPWSIGCETLDRDFVDFTHTGPHLADLGATQARVQAGWAKCEPVPGRYAWAWLDAVVDGCVAQGVRPWLQTSYGNPHYLGGGGIGLSEGLPESPEALAAWDRWVTAMVTRYHDRVDTWEIWNEPDNPGGPTAEAYTQFFIRTVRLIRAAQPHARIVGLGLATDVPYAEIFLRRLHASGQTALLDEISYHIYPHNPDERFDVAEALLALLARYAPHATLRQGETGAPSEARDFMALRGFSWSERKQAVWNTRRMLAHHARGIPMNLFALADMHYKKSHGRFEGYNPKGLVATGPDLRVTHRKPAYAAAQHVFSLFDDRFAPAPVERLPTSPAGVAAYVWKFRSTAAPAWVGWWEASQPPYLAPAPFANVQFSELPRLRDPLLVDLLTGEVFAVPPAWLTSRQLPVGDAPLLLAERTALYLA